MRYSRHIILKEVGAKGQKKLLKGKVLIIGAGPTGICTMLCVMLKSPKHIIMCEKDEERIQFINKHYPDVLTVSPEECEEFVKKQVIMVEQMLFLKLPELNQRFALHGSAQDRMQL